MRASCCGMILSGNRFPLFGIMPFRPVSSPFETPGQYALLGMQSVLGLVEYDRLRTVDDLVRDLVATVRRQAMHEDRVGPGVLHQPGIDLIGLEQIVAPLAVAVSHRDPGVGDDTVGVC